MLLLRQMSIRHCPFCGCEDVKTECHHNRLVRAYIQCNHCAARGSVIIEETREKAIEAAARAWNGSTPTIWYEIKRIIRLRLSHYIPHDWIPL